MTNGLGAPDPAEVAAAKLNLGVLLAGNNDVKAVPGTSVGVDKGLEEVGGPAVSEPVACPNGDVEVAEKGLLFDAGLEKRLAASGREALVEGWAKDGRPKELLGVAKVTMLEACSGIAGSTVPALFLVGWLPFSFFSVVEMASSESSLRNNVSSSFESSSTNDSSIYPSIRAFETLIPSITAGSVRPRRFLSTKVFDSTCFLRSFMSAYFVRSSQLRGYGAD